MTKEQVKEMMDEDLLKKCTIPALKEILASFGQKVGGTKGQLLDRLTAYLTK